MKEWQRGYELDHLKSITAVFEAHDKGLVLGAFTGVSERQVADWLAAGELHEVKNLDGPPVGYWVGQRVPRAKKIRDFRGQPIAEVSAGALEIQRAACWPGSAEALSQAIKDWVVAEASVPELWLQGWVEQPTDRWLAESLLLQPYGVKIRASSELIGVWGRSSAGPQELPIAEGYGLARLSLQPDPAPLAAALSRSPGEFAQHYSGYNKRGSWTALSLRGYADDPSFIVKPAEMSRKWKAEHPEFLQAPVRDTPARDLYPEAEQLIELVPGAKERIRLMALAPGGGELTRHSDITDPDSGIADGRLARIHFPIITNPEVRFTMWRLNGAREQAIMRAGSSWYLDTRKPHTAVNGGESERIHLVMDVESSPDLRRLLAEAAPLLEGP